VLANLAAVYKRCKQFDNCIETYRRSVSAAPDAFELWLKLASALLERGRVDESTQCYQSAATLNPRSSAVLRPLVFTAMRASKPHVALQAAKDFSRLAPNSIAAALDMSSASLAIGDPHTALTQADRALAFTPGHRVALSNKAIAAHELGLFDVSRYLVDLKKLLQTRVLTAPPDYPNLRALNLELVAHIENHPTLEFDVDSLSCHGGRTSGELLVEPKGPIGNLEQMIRAAVHDYVEALPTSAAHPFINSRPEEFSMTAWATILETSGHQSGHIHASAWLSGVYYVSLPGDMNATDETYAGWRSADRRRITKISRHLKSAAAVPPRDASCYFRRTSTTGQSRSNRSNGGAASRSTFVQTKKTPRAVLKDPSQHPKEVRPSIDCAWMKLDSQYWSDRKQHAGLDRKSETWRECRVRQFTGDEFAPCAIGGAVTRETRDS